MTIGISGTLRRMAVLASLTLLAILICSAWAADARTIRPLTAGEMRGAVGLQTYNNMCVMFSSSMCQDRTTGPPATCSQNSDCVQCVEHAGDVAHLCNGVSGVTCTVKPSIPCGEKTEGVCAPDD
jgi:hypothetical protein